MVVLAVIIRAGEEEAAMGEVLVEAVAMEEVWVVTAMGEVLVVAVVMEEGWVVDVVPGVV